MMLILFFFSSFSPLLVSLLFLSFSLLPMERRGEGRRATGHPAAPPPLLGWQISGIIRVFVQGGRRRRRASVRWVCVPLIKNI